MTALAHPVRLRILDFLRQGEAGVDQIQAALELRQAYISQHLTVLRRAHLVATRRQGVRMFYRLGNEQVTNLLEQAAGLVMALN